MDQQPPLSPNPPTTPPPAAPNPPTPPTGPSSPMQPHSNKNLIIGVVVAAVVALLIIAGVVVAIAMSGNKSDNKNTNDNNTTNQQDDDALRSANAETANSLSDFDVVCDNGSISNAAAYEKPYKVTAFASNSTTRSASTVSLPFGADYNADYKDYAATNIVACLAEKEGSAVKSKTCDFKSGGETVKLDFYALKYALTLREAKTGKLIKELGEVNGPATTCPFFVSYSKDDPKYYARPDSDAVGMAIEKFIAQQ